MLGGTGSQALLVVLGSRSWGRIKTSDAQWAGGEKTLVLRAPDSEGWRQLPHLCVSPGLKSQDPLPGTTQEAPCQACRVNPLRWQSAASQL